MNRFLHKLTIRAQMVLLAFFTGAIMLVIILLTYFQVSGLVTRYNDEYTENMMYQIESTIAGNCRQIGQVLTGVAFNRTVQTYIGMTDPEEKYRTFKDINSYMISLASMYDGIIDIAVVDRNGQRVYFLNGENEQVKEAILQSQASEGVYFSPIVEIEYVSGVRKCFVVSTDIKSILYGNSSGGILGRAAVVIDADLLSMDVNPELNESNTRFYLLDRSNHVYSRSQATASDIHDDAYMDYAAVPPGTYSTRIGATNYVVNKTDISAYGGKLISVVPEQQLLKDINRTRLLAIGLFFGALALLSVPFMVIMHNIVNPLNKFVRFFTLVKEKKLGGLKQRLDAGGYREMAVMVGQFNGLLDEIDSLTQKLVQTNSRLYEAEIEQKKSELSYLKSQINPHFLYNTLEVLKGSAIDEGAEKTHGMAKALAQVFRYSVKGADVVTLREEVEIIRHYLYIQQVRFNGRIRVEYCFSDRSLECRIPQMILQPIVENAVFHGLEMKLGEGCIRLEADVDQFYNLVVVVQDDGIGMDGETLEKIRESMSWANFGISRHTAGNERIGIKNVDNRIRLMYGGDYGISIESEPGLGTKVTIRLPARSE